MKHLLRILILLLTVASARGAIVANPFTAAPPNSMAAWWWPPVGNQLAQVVDYATSVSSGTPVTNFSATGAGKVTGMRLVMQGSLSFSQFTNLVLHISCDGGADTINLPWCYFAGVMRTNINDLVASKADTLFFKIHDLRSTILDFELMYPVPFTNGCTIWTTTTLSENIASRVEYLDQMPTNTASYMRIHATNFDTYIGQESIAAGTVAITTANPTYLVGTGTAFDSTLIGKYIILPQSSFGSSLEIVEALVTAVTNSTAATVSWGTSPRTPVLSNQSGLSYLVPTPYVFLNRPAATAGVVASVIGMTTNWLVMPNTRWFLNQHSTPDYEYWDTEQMFGGNNGFDMQPYQASETGQISISADQVFWAGYRHFPRGLWYTNGIKMMVNHLGDLMDNLPSAGTAFPSRISYAVVYYE